MDKYDNMEWVESDTYVSKSWLDLYKLQKPAKSGDGVWS